MGNASQPRGFTPAEDPPALLADEDRERAGERLRLALRSLTQAAAPPIPLNYALGYFFVAGIDDRFNAEYLQLVEAGEWDHAKAVELFLRYFSPCSDIVALQLHQEVLRNVDGVVVSSLTTASQAKQRSDRIDTQLRQIETAERPGRLHEIGLEILHEGRGLARDASMHAAELEHAASRIEALKRELSLARKDAMTDSLTGLANRRVFDDLMESLIQRDQPFVLVLMDIDHFKQINDTHGHLVGDRVLQQLAKVARAKIRDTDHAARYGGDDELAFLLPGASAERGFQVAEDIRQAIETLRMRRRENDEEIGQVTASFGVSAWDGREPAERLIERADQALYAAKAKGRNRVVKRPTETMRE